MAVYKIYMATNNHMKKVMFQGDSITDADRNRSDNHFMAGYTQFVKDALDGQFEFLNYGISGDTSRNILARHKKEVEIVKPDFLVTLIGINDVWRNAHNVVEEATTSEEFINNVIEIIKQTKAIVPHVKIIFLEPFLLPGSSEVYERGYDLYKKNMALLQANVPQMVDKYISLQDFFLTHTTEDMVYLRDGVHPSENGQKVLAENVINALKELNK